MNKYIVYKHTTPSGKVYIGITRTTLERRCGSNGRNYSKNILFYRAIQKYGWQNIKHEILFDGLTKEQATTKEVELIAEYQSNNSLYGYNISVGGESGNAGIIASEETRKKMSLAHIGNPSNTGKKLSEETRQKLSIARKGNKNMLGKKLSEETRKKMSEAQKGEKNHFYGKKHTPETIEKMKAARRAREVRRNG